MTPMGKQPGLRGDESSGMSTGEAWNRCGITEAEYFRTEDKNCPYVDENGNDNGKFDELMRE